LGHLLYNINSAINSNINQLNDAGTLQNTGGGFIAKTLNISGGMKPFKLSEWKMVDSYGGSIRDAIVPLPHAEPSQTLFVLMQFLVITELGKNELKHVKIVKNKPFKYMALVDSKISAYKNSY
jgi:hypothetical protein